MLSTCIKCTTDGMQNKNIFSGKAEKFEVRIIQTIKKIEERNEKIDAETIFRVITKDSATNITVENIEQKLCLIKIDFKTETIEQKNECIHSRYQLGIQQEYSNSRSSST